MRRARPTRPILRVIQVPRFIREDRVVTTHAERETGPHEARMPGPLTLVALPIPAFGAPTLRRLRLPRRLIRPVNQT